jgi:Zn-finger nucleic acid-binding protein
MQCPVCLKPMQAQELFEVETNLCQFCGGAWLDAGELAEYVRKGNVPNRLLANYCIDDSMKKVDEGNRECPRCHNLLQLLTHRGVKIDFCYRCKGVWFDKGELKELLLGYYNELDEETKQKRKHTYQGIQTIKCDSGDENEDIIKFFDDEIFEGIEEVKESKPLSNLSPGKSDEFCIETELLGGAEKEEIAKALPKQVKEKKQVNYSPGGFSQTSLDMSTGVDPMRMLAGRNSFFSLGGRPRNFLGDAIFDFVWSLFTGR